jgi:hypothetical protein
MKRIAVALLLGLTFVALASAQSPVKKYDIKSGIVTYESNMKMGDFEIKTKDIVYFDDYGMKECKETYSNNKLEESFFSDGKDLYSVKHKQKAAFKRGSAYRGTELRVEWSEFGTEKDRQSGKYKKLPATDIAGKKCEMFIYDDGKGTVTTYGGWDKILMYLKVKTKGMETVQKAVKVEENAKVVPDKFKVPTGFTVQ